MNTAYKSEFGTGVTIAMVASIVIVFLATRGNWWATLFTSGLLVLCLLFLYKNTRYKICDKELRIQAGFKHQTIPIDKITSIESHYSFYNIPNVYALSEQRLLINYGTNQFVNISPQARKDFIADLLRYNPDIRVSQALVH